MLRRKKKMIDEWLGLPNYFKTAYFWISTSIIVIVVSIWAWKWDKWEHDDERRRASKWMD